MPNCKMPTRMLGLVLLLGLLPPVVKGQCCIPEIESKFGYLADTTPAWGYEEPHITPDHWGTVAATCLGPRQSPIDLPVPASSASPPKPEWLREFVTNQTYTGSLTFTNNGHSFMLDLTPWQFVLASSVLTDGVYNLLQLHFHGGSEHTFAGKRYPLEVHFVHQRKGSTGTDGLVVFGFVYDYSSTNTPDLLLSNLIGKLPAATGDTTTVTTAVPLASYIQDSSFWTYPGSLTTPPCSESVTWFVSTRPITASHAQIDALATALGDTYRPTQPLNGRQPQLILPVQQMPEPAAALPARQGNIIFNNFNAADRKFP